jgi:hypothetical protein
MKEIISELEPYLVGYAIGIRFRPNFFIEDQIGRIVDDILYGKGSTFDYKFFPEAAAGIGGKILIDKVRGNSLTIDNSNFIVDLNMADNVVELGVDNLTNAFDEEIIQGIMRRYRVKEIARIGLVRRYIFDVEQLANSFVAKTIGAGMEKVEDIDLKFSKRQPTSAGMSQRDVFDYDNIIFNVIKQAGKREIFVSVDYQRIYSPLLSSVSDINYTSFLLGALAYNKNSFLPWLESKYLSL